MARVDALVSLHRLFQVQDGVHVDAHHPLGHQVHRPGQGGGDCPQTASRPDVLDLRLLADGADRVTGQIAEALGLPGSTCSYHLRQLLEAGVTECRAEGTARIPTLRRDELDRHFPGLVELVLANLTPPTSVRAVRRRPR